MSARIAANAFLLSLAHDIEMLNAIGAQVNAGAWQRGPGGGVGAKNFKPADVGVTIDYTTIGGLLEAAQTFKDGDRLSDLWDADGGIDDTVKCNRYQGWYADRLAGVLHDQVAVGLIAQAGPFYAIALSYYGAVARLHITQQRLDMAEQIKGVADGCASAAYAAVGGAPELGTLLIPTSWGGDSAAGGRLANALRAIDSVAATRSGTLPVYVDRPPAPDVPEQCDNGGSSSGTNADVGMQNGGPGDGEGIGGGQGGRDFGGPGGLGDATSSNHGGGSSGSGSGGTENP